MNLEKLPPDTNQYSNKKIIIKLIWILNALCIILFTLILIVLPPKIIYTLKMRADITRGEENIYYYNEDAHLYEILHINGKVDIQATNTNDYVLIYEGRTKYNITPIYYYIININTTGVDEIY